MKFAIFLLGLVLAWPTHAAAPAADNSVESIDALLMPSGFNGVVRVSRQGEKLFERTYGQSNIEADIEVRPDTRFRIASITKLFTAVLVARLVEEGKLDYGATIHTYLPDYSGEGGPVVTLQQLLTHTSGIANSDTVGSFEEAVAEGMPIYQMPATPVQTMQRYASGKLVNPPGSTFDYNNADFLVLGRIIEKVTGLSYVEALRKYVLDPTGLTATGMMDWKALTPVVATGYLCLEKGQPCIHELPVYHENWDAAGGLYSTAEDITKFSDALFDGRLLRPESLDRLLRAEKDEYAHGLWVAPVKLNGRPDRVAHRPGSIMGANTVLVHYLDDGLTVVMLANTNAAPIDDLAFDIARRFAP